MNKYILRKIYLCDSFGFNVFSFSALEVSVFTGTKDIQVFCFLMIYMIVEFSSKIKRETVFLDLSRYTDPGNFSSETFSETYNPSKIMFWLLRVIKHTSGSYNFLSGDICMADDTQVLLSQAVFLLCVCVCSQLWLCQALCKRVQLLPAAFPYK